MTKISKDFDGQTVLTTFEMTPGTAQELMDALTDAYENFISRQPGFISAGLHMNDAQTRIANYSQWRDRKDFQAMLRTPEMRDRNKHIHGLCSRFEPVMYEVVAAF
ncbi:quinol monooxygenase YgiN [Defluviimonas denitrificans]|jgi:quinol monooxygenase YgiN|uniref:Quinol monooxygenase YgiN n=1 Tax=Albidovulum denitrificans TaxID=404881 RepID=A0A2S8S4A8_9RHOB|nr:antibiotic biosynthesis monooxygenase family protein [Defluviimonas denitrificans]PQV55623.1 quinol monooxygenase YgiN [Defluviimonas denitrificans]